MSELIDHKVHSTASILSAKKIFRSNSLDYAWFFSPKTRFCSQKMEILGAFGRPF